MATPANHNDGYTVEFTYEEVMQHGRSLNRLQFGAFDWESICYWAREQAEFDAYLRPHERRRNRSDQRLQRVRDWLDNRLELNESALTNVHI